LINEWARTLTAQLPTVSDYAQNFIDWLSTEPSVMFPESPLRVVHRELNEFYRQLHSDIQIEALWDWDSDEILDVVATQISKKSEWLQSLAVCQGVTDVGDRALLNQLGIDVEEKVRIFFEELNEIDSVLSELIDLSPLVLSRAHSLIRETEFGFIGFGRDEYFSTMYRFTLKGVYGNIVRITSEQTLGSPARRDLATVSNFGLDDAIKGFLTGADYEFINEVTSYFDGVLKTVDPDNELVVTHDEMLREVRERTSELQKSKHVNPALKTLAVMGLWELGNTAKSLVEIQALRSRLAGGQLEVGGQIEALVIDRANGIRWINRLPQPTPHYPA
jgi:hypothetical protein